MTKLPFILKEQMHRALQSIIGSDMYCSKTSKDVVPWCNEIGHFSIQKLLVFMQSALNILSLITYHTIATIGRKLMNEEVCPNNLTIS